MHIGQQSVIIQLDLMLLLRHLLLILLDLSIDLRWHLPRHIALTSVTLLLFLLLVLPMVVVLITTCPIIGVVDRVLTCQ